MDLDIEQAYEPRNRRQLRSSLAYQAAEIYLAKHRVEHGWRAIALADPHGLPLVCVGSNYDAELLALWGALNEVERQRYRDEMDALRQGETCITQRIQIDDVVYALTGIGHGGGFGATIALDLERIFARATAS